MLMSATPLTYGQSINDHYEVVFTRYIQRKNELPPAGWKKVTLHLPQKAIRVDPREEDRLMEELLRLIREKCSTADPKKTNPQGLRIDKLDGSEVVNKYLQGATLMLYPGKSLPQSAWINVAPVAGPTPGGGFLRT
jgi:hypothetical protein